MPREIEKEDLPPDKDGEGFPRNILITRGSVGQRKADAARSIDAVVWK